MSCFKKNIVYKIPPGGGGKTLSSSRPSMYSCTILAQCRTQGRWRLGSTWPPIPKRPRVSYFFAHYMILRVYKVMILGGLVEVWGDKECFGVVLGVLMDHTTVMLKVKCESNSQLLHLSRASHA